MTETCSQVTTLAPADAAPQARLRRAAAAHHPPADPGRRDPRPGPDRRAAAAPTPTAGCTPATSADIDEEGFLYVTGRSNELIVSGGENVMPAEVEAVLLATRRSPTPPSSGAPDPEWQEAVLRAGRPRRRLPRRRRRSSARHCAELRSPATRCRSGSTSSSSLPRTAVGQAAAGQLPSRPAASLRRLMAAADEVLYDKDADLSVARGQDRRDPRLRLPGPRPRAQPEGLRRRRRRRPAPRLLQPRRGRRPRARGARRRRRRQPGRRRDDPAARREAGRDLARARSPTGSPTATC